MTYRELRELINGLTELQLEARAVYFDSNVGETFDVVGLSENPSDDYGHDDDSQPILKIEQ